MAEPVAGRPPTIRTVAARAGVSKSLVSLVLQNSPHVSDAKREAVLKAVAELGYRPDPVARSLAERRTRPSIVAGPLCESGDVFTQNAAGVVEPRDLAPTEVGDLLVFHDTGAYGSSMSSNYNTRPLAAEVLVDGATARVIRRRQTVAELIALED